MNTNGMFQSSEEERLKMMNCCCMPSDNVMSSIADVVISLALIRRIEHLEGELTKNGIEIPEWKDLINNG